MQIERLNPEGMYSSPVYSQVVTVSGAAKLIFVGGQDGILPSGEVAGETIGDQARQSYLNVKRALEAAGASLRNVVKMTIYLVQGQSIQDAYAAIQPLQEQGAPPPVVSMIYVAGLGDPAWLIEIEAMAVIGEE